MAYVVYNVETGELVAQGRLFNLPSSDGLAEKEVSDAYSGAVVWDSQKRDYVYVEDLPQSKFSPYDFNLRFTLEESIAIENSDDPVVKHLLHLFNTADEVDLNEPQVIQGLTYFQSLGLLTEQRKNQILGK